MSIRSNLIIFVGLLFCQLLAAQTPNMFDRDIWVAQKKFATQKNMDEKVRTGFFIADLYMDLDKYDSAQIWLNNIADFYSIKEPTLFNYFLLTRQSEVYYYNNLLQLGLLSAKRALSVASGIHDSLLMADAYNMIGLMYLSMDSCTNAKKYFFSGISFAKSPPYPAKYFALSNPHHLFGNMAEALEKLNENDSAIVYSYKSLQQAEDIGNERGMAVAHAMMGQVFLKLNAIDSSEVHYLEAQTISQASADIDVELLSYAGLAGCASAKNNYPLAQNFIRKGFEFIQQYPSINSFFTNEYLHAVLSIYKMNNDQDGIYKTYQQIIRVDSIRYKNNFDQVENILRLSAKNENRYLKLEVEEIKNKSKLATTRLYLVIIGFLFVAGFFVSYRYFIRQRLKVEILKNNISQDLHDDLGASLSSLLIYSSLANDLMDEKPADAKKLISEVSRGSQQAIEKMDDIVWAMKPPTEEGELLEARIKNYGSSLLTAKNIYCHYDFCANTDMRIKNMEARKNILLIMKEAINNIAKYSDAKNVHIKMQSKGNHVLLSIEDNGVGFDINNHEKGNGLENMRNRAQKMGGVLKLSSKLNAGTQIWVDLPLTNISDR